jgi:arylsulfatase A-like enzyme
MSDHATNDQTSRASPRRAPWVSGWYLLAAWSYAVLTCGPALGAQVLSRSQMAPNIVFILAQNLGTNDLSCYGSRLVSTANIDRLASSGIRFNQCYTGSPLGIPARATLLTGLHTGHAPIRGLESAYLGRQDATVAEVLKRYGYRTAAMGLWGLGSVGSAGLPTRKGFDEWLGFLLPDHARQLYPEQLWRNEKKLVIEDNLNGNRAVSGHNLFTRAATNFISLHRSKPFFIYLACTLPGYGVPLTNASSTASAPEDPNRATRLKWLDDDVGRILATLEHFKLQSNTVIFFSSDGRDSAGDQPGLVSSSSPNTRDPDCLKENRLRVPMVVCWPGVFPAGRTSDFPWAFWDFLSTAADLAEATRPEDLDGLSVLPTLLGRSQKPHDYFYWEVPGPPLVQAVRQGNWKAIRATTDDLGGLYDLTNDAWEQTNSARFHPQIWSELTNLMNQAHASPRLSRPGS